MERRSRRMAALVALCQVSARDENRIELDASRDRFGVPVARTIFSMDENDKGLLAFTEDEGTRVFEAAGALEHWIPIRGTAHAMGGTVMGADAAASVTDSFGLSHDVPNLAIAGGGLFPTGGAVNPTFTIHALALRTAEHITANWSALS